MPQAVAKTKNQLPYLNNNLKTGVREFSYMTPVFFSVWILATKVIWNILTTNKDSHNDETVFDPSQNERLDINPSCFMKMPFICPSTMMILSELTE